MLNIPKPEMVLNIDNLDHTRTIEYVPEPPSEREGEESEEAKRRKIDLPPRPPAELKVVGTSFEGRSEVIKKIVVDYCNDNNIKIEDSVYTDCYILPEPTNKYDKKALKVMSTYNSCDYHIGYIDKDIAKIHYDYLSNLKCTMILVAGDIPHSRIFI